jgi:hypothetical protein
MTFMHYMNFSGRRAVSYAVWTVKAGVAYNRMYALPAHINITETGAYMPGSGVIAKNAAIPPSTVKPYTAITKSIINTAIVANCWPPIAVMPAVITSIKAPVTGCP